MGKRSDFDRIPRDFYPTPRAAVVPLIPHLRGVRSFAEPCCGDGQLVRHLESFGLRCAYGGDIVDGQDALARASYGMIDAIITNPPYRRPVMHALISHFQGIAPTWLLLELDWAATRQAVPHLVSCSDIVTSVGSACLRRRRLLASRISAGSDSTRGTPAVPSFIPISRRRHRGSAVVRNVVSRTSRTAQTRSSVRMRADNEPTAIG